jgi:hypothetical protein
MSSSVTENNQSCGTSVTIRLDHVSYHVLTGGAKRQAACTHDAMTSGSVHTGLRVASAFKQANRVVVL